MEIRRPQGRTVRVAAGVGAVAAAGVTVVFATVGDGVDAEARGVRGAVLEHGHTAVWVLLTAALTITAVGRGPRWLPRTIGYASLAVYAGFLAALIFGAG
ncbi:hypothetical protein ABGB12_26115 [Actinocorallia sp. B10E7]|uniref:hypothetical protein n=1 Tax=Actinocorallia sp. B10E7 TaxID=3153558 RepID=UPI00325DB374